MGRAGEAHLRIEEFKKEFYPKWNFDISLLHTIALVDNARKQPLIFPLWLNNLAKNFGFPAISVQQVNAFRSFVTKGGKSGEILYPANWVKVKYDIEAQNTHLRNWSEDKKEYLPKFLVCLLAEYEFSLNTDVPTFFTAVMGNPNLVLNHEAGATFCMRAYRNLKNLTLSAKSVEEYAHKNYLYLLAIQALRFANAGTAKTDTLLHIFFAASTEYFELLVERKIIDNARQRENSKETKASKEYTKQRDEHISLMFEQLDKITPNKLVFVFSHLIEYVGDLIVYLPAAVRGHEARFTALISKTFKAYPSQMLWYYPQLHNRYIDRDVDKLFVSKVLAELGPLQQKVQALNTLLENIRKSIEYGMNSVSDREKRQTALANQKIAKAIEKEITRLDVFNTPLPTELIFPMISQIAPTKPDKETANFDPFPKSNIIIVKAMPERFRIFESKDKPILLCFECFDTKSNTKLKKSLIFKTVTNTSGESIITTLMINQLSDFQSTQSPLSEFFTTMNTSMIHYKVLSLSNTFLTLEVVDNVMDINNIVEKTQPFFTETNSMSDQQEQKERQIREYISSGIQTTLQKLFQGCNYISWYEKIVNINYSHAYWSAVSFTFGVGDRNLANIMMNLEKAMFLYIDFECIFDAGRKLPVPEVREVRLGPLFQRVLGLNYSRGLFRSVMCEYLRHLRQRDLEIYPELTQFLRHGHEPMFISVLNFCSESYCRGFLSSKIGGETKGKELEAVDDIIYRNIDKAVDKQMFIGWNPHL